MSAFFVSASSQRLLNSVTPSTAYPFTVGLWVMPTTTGVAKVIFDNNDGATGSFARLETIATNVFQINADAFVATAGTVVANQWFYLVGRFISATNRRLSVLTQDGTSSNAQSVTSGALVGLVNMTLGASGSAAGAAFFDGNIAEFFITNTDIQPDGAALQDSTLRQLARCGPLSIPHIANRLVDYRSLQHDMGSNADSRPYYFGNNGLRKTWVNTNAVTVGTHPPYLAPQYAGPNDVRRLGVV